MPVSRSESRQHQKQQRARRMKRLFAINLVLLLIIGALAVVYVVQRQDGKEKLNNTAAGSDSAGQTANAGNESGTDDQSPDQANTDASETPETDDPTEGHTTYEPISEDEPSSDNEAATGGTVTPAAGERVNLSFTGDVLLAASVEKLMLKNGYEYPYAKVLNQLKTPDLMAVNLETPVTLRGTPAENKQYVYKSSPDALPALKAAGIDVVNLANNHTLDQGEEGLLDTIGHLDEAGIPNMGAGRDELEAFKPVLLEAKGISVAFLGLTRVIPVGSWKATKDHAGLAETYDSTRAVAAIKQAKTQADIVVVMVHWGIEREDLPNNDQKRLAHEYIDAGADLVIGSHPHVLQGFESYKGKWIAYSLGNFIFSGMTPDTTKDTGVLDAACNVKGDCSLKFQPMRAVQSQPAPLAGEEGVALLKRMSSISFHATVDEAGNIQSKE
ncbi:CapA family protein [Paenibacillus sp. CF384]|uniref:CapA family protein n=1 Tax=Paenibacillus sp. CF384 TaxID=1884382 RepID=UPI00089B083E|nr:CapA family protein [Paenibacillus sp. CF384]SDX19165.1 poly-gamma-glutamate synthesis protein (capsule biosynthesis protein) [Paenibacillus sp. CF384]